MEFIAVTVSYNYCYFWSQYKYLASPKIHRAQLLKKFTAKGHSDKKIKRNKEKQHDRFI